MVFLGELNSPEAFKIVNLAVAGLSVLCGLSQLFSGFQSFFLGLYIIAFGAVIGLLEFSVPSQATTYGSFLFSFIGRGIAYTLVGVCINGASLFRIFSAIVIFLTGVAFVALEFVPSVSLPDNMNPEGMSLDVHEEDVV